MDLQLPPVYLRAETRFAASALLAGCKVLVSEDMHHGQVPEGRLKIQNAFV